jgi:hypothetical protein
MRVALRAGFRGVAGAALFGHVRKKVLAVTTAVAACAILPDTMIAEGFEEAGDFAGLITGFLVAFILRRLEAGS